MTKLVKYQGRKVGIIDGSAYISHRRPEHFCRKFNGWGIQDEIYMKTILPCGLTDIIIVVGPTRYYSKVADWERHLRRGTLRPDAGEQVFLDTSYFRAETV